MAAVARLVGLQAAIDVEGVAQVGVRVVFDEDGWLAGLDLDGRPVEACSGRNEQFISVDQIGPVEAIGHFDDDSERAALDEADAHAGRLCLAFEGIRAGGGPGSIAIEDALDRRQSGVTGAARTMRTPVMPLIIS